MTKEEYNKKVSELVGKCVVVVFKNGCEAGILDKLSIGNEICIVKNNFKKTNEGYTSNAGYKIPRKEIEIMEEVPLEELANCLIKVSYTHPEIFFRMKEGFR